MRIQPSSGRAQNGIRPPDFHLSTVYPLFLPSCLPFGDHWLSAYYVPDPVPGLHWPQTQLAQHPLPPDPKY